MAAIIDPNRLPTSPRRPQLRLVPAHGGRPVDVPVGLAHELGLGARHLGAAIAAIALAVLFAVAVGSGALASLVPAPASPAAGVAESGTAVAPVVEVQAGDTLWTIARRLQPVGDVRPLVDQLVALNGTSPLVPGGQVVIPG
jgi:hypothetical protein